ncbi:membrane protein [Propionigenium maris DSM 9537]|uniref:Membrane protein n=1 Tax=Propionigenium maris DSM 9537 TaxID=1123000 RepID=A0A9W6GGG9_9FUSO|nr:lipocalin family protein [Propionigenium maris]GLI54819.1 membrane protein [Propionigenium maris DSM 9537]
MYRYLLILLLLFTACDSGEKIGVADKGIKDFKVERYMGEWHEVARIDNRFERGLTRVTARYYRDSEGRIRVVNRGWNAEKNKWKEARGWIRTTEVSGRLRVSFFRPFYSDYRVLQVEEDYRYALVGGSRRNYLWILSREEEIPEDLVEEYTEKARELGYEVDRLIFFNK